MPYHLEGNCVKKEDGSTVPGGCHENHDDAVKHLRALEMNVDEAHKLDDGGDLAKTFTRFIPLSKIEERPDGSVMVYGWAAEEALDKTGEIMDYAASKPNFTRWSELIKSMSGGESLGNLRAMHKKDHAAGRIIVFEPHDELKKFWIGAEVVDPVDKLKVLKKVYTGFSVGGGYGRIWPDPVLQGAKRYEAIPNEISLADNPAQYGALIEMVKADGSKSLEKIAPRAADEVVEPSTIISTRPEALEEFEKLARLSGLDKISAAVTFGGQSYDGFAQSVKTAWYRQFAAGGVYSSGATDFVTDVLTTGVIVNSQGSLVYYPYNKEGESFVFGQPVPVEVQYVAKFEGEPADEGALAFDKSVFTSQLMKIFMASAVDQDDKFEWADPFHRRYPMRTAMELAKSWTATHTPNSISIINPALLKAMENRMVIAFERVTGMPAPQEWTATAEAIHGVPPIVSEIAKAREADLAKIASMVDPNRVRRGIRAEIDGVLEKIARRGDVSAGAKESAEGEASHFADPVNAKYKLDTEEEIRAAWNYIHQEKNRSKYSAADAKTIEGRIIAAWKKKIDKDGPPSAESK